MNNEAARGNRAAFLFAMMLKMQVVGINTETTIPIFTLIIGISQ